MYAGTINQSGALEVRTEKLGRDTSFGKIIEAVESVERSRAPIQRLADRLAGYLVYFALGAAALTFLITRDPRSTISVVIVAGACGIAAGTPLAVLGAIGRAAREGIIIKGGRYLEALSAVNTVVLDKTGTLTYGKPEVVALLPAPGIAPRVLLGTAVIAERRSEHPLGEAILTRAHVDVVAVAEPETFQYTPGRGIRAVFDGETILVGNHAFLVECNIDLPATSESRDDATMVLVAYAARFLGAIGIADTLRPEASDAIVRLRALSIRTVLLTGDARNVAEAVANLLPDQKRQFVAALVDDRKIVAMVGDGETMRLLSPRRR